MAVETGQGEDRVMPIDPYAPFRFRYRDRRTGRWVQSAHPRLLEDIDACFDEWQVNGVADPVIGIPSGTPARHCDVTVANEPWSLPSRRAA
jgi:hypothetical protein